MSRKPKRTLWSRELEYLERLRCKREKIAGLRSLMATYEQAGDVDEARRLAVKIRLNQQQLIYMEK